MSRRRYDGRSGRDPYYAGRRGGRSNGDGSGCLVLLILAIVAMPLVGLYLLTKKDGDGGTKVIGGILLVVGVIIWIYIGVKAGH